MSYCDGHVVLVKFHRKYNFVGVARATVVLRSFHAGTDLRISYFRRSVRILKL